MCVIGVSLMLSVLRCSCSYTCCADTGVSFTKHQIVVHQPSKTGQSDLQEQDVVLRAVVLGTVWPNHITVCM